MGGKGLSSKESQGEIHSIHREPRGKGDSESVKKFLGGGGKKGGSESTKRSCQKKEGNSGGGSREAFFTGVSAGETPHQSLKRRRVHRKALLSKEGKSEPLESEDLNAAKKKDVPPTGKRGEWEVPTPDKRPAKERYILRHERRERGREQQQSGKRKRVGESLGRIA